MILVYQRVIEWSSDMELYELLQRYYETKQILTTCTESLTEHIATHMALTPHRYYTDAMNDRYILISQIIHDLDTEYVQIIDRLSDICVHIYEYLNKTPTIVDTEVINDCVSAGSHKLGEQYRISEHVIEARAYEKSAEILAYIESIQIHVPVEPAEADLSGPDDLSESGTIRVEELDIGG